LTNYDVDRDRDDDVLCLLQMASDYDETSCMKKREKNVTRTWQQREYRQERRDKKYSEKETEKKLERGEISGTNDCAQGSHAVARFTISRAHLTVVLVSLS